MFFEDAAHHAELSTLRSLQCPIRRTFHYLLPDGKTDSCSPWRSLSNFLDTKDKAFWRALLGVVSLGVSIGLAALILQL